MSNMIAGDVLRSYIERIERLEEEKKSITDDIKDVYAEAKANGFNAKALKEIIKLRAMDKDERAELEATMDLYMHALGMDGTPLWEAAGVEEPEQTISERAKAKRPSRRQAEAIKDALAGMGTPVPLTEEEKAKGVTAAFVGKDGTRSSIAFGMRAPVDHDPETGEILDPVETAAKVVETHDDIGKAAESLPAGHWDR